MDSSEVLQKREERLSLFEVLDRLAKIRECLDYAFKDTLSFQEQGFATNKILEAEQFLVGLERLIRRAAVSKQNTEREIKNRQLVNQSEDKIEVNIN